MIKYITKLSSFFPPYCFWVKELLFALQVGMNVDDMVGCWVLFAQVDII